ncbi:MAG: hypothetical protein WDM77_17675 [Steroidobacteraceae bacterium]
MDLDPEAVQLLERYHTQFVRAGARLNDAEKSGLKAINTQISSLTTRFRQNVLKATSDGAGVVDSAAELAGLAAEQVGAAAEAAAARGTGRQMADRAAEHHHPAAAGATVKSRAARPPVQSLDRPRTNRGDR